MNLSLNPNKCIADFGGSVTIEYCSFGYALSHQIAEFFEELLIRTAKPIRVSFKPE